MDRAKSYCLILLLAIAQVAGAESIQDLLDAGKLEARAVVKTLSPHSQKAPIEIVVEVGTPVRFKGGTRVRDFTVPGTLVRRTTRSAFNETRRRDGDSWDFQSWRFELHAERLGKLRVPPLNTFISVETEEDGLVEGEIKLTVPSLQIETPPGTESLESWVAANKFKVEESWEGELESYEIGDAVTRIRTFTIQGAPAMAIPASPRIDLKGVDIYHAPPSVDDQEVGGLLEGVREERVVFTFKGGGSFAIPDDRIHWFKVGAGVVEPIDLPGRSLEVSGPAAPAAKNEPKAEGDPVKLWPWLLAGVGIGLAYLLFRWIRRATWPRRLRERLALLGSHRRMKAAFKDAATRQDSRGCLDILYQRMSEHAEWQLSAACGHDPRLRATSEALMAHAYGDGPAPEVKDVLRLWELGSVPRRRPAETRGLSLNPGPSGGGSAAPSD